MGKHTHLLRKGGSWLYAVVSDWGKQRLESWRRFGSDRQKSWRNGRATCPGLAAASLSYHAADSRHVVGRAPRRKCCCREAQADTGRVESDRRAGWLKPKEERGLEL